MPAVESLDRWYQSPSIPAERAYDHVFGYTVHNDITSPTMRTEDTYHYRAIHVPREPPRDAMPNTLEDFLANW